MICIGYILLWKDVSAYTTAWNPINDAISSESQCFGDNIPINTTISVCTGSEWYQFPSNFFLPEHSQLQYIEDGFTGVLPQHFAPKNGTFITPLQPFNDRNEEEPSRYVSLYSCHYLVVLVDYNDDYLTSCDNECLNSNECDVNQECNKATIGKMLRRSLIETDDDSLALGAFELVTERPVISTRFSTSVLPRAYYIPTVSSSAVKFQSYALYRNIYL